MAQKNQTDVGYHVQKISRSQLVSIDVAYYKNCLKAACLCGSILRAKNKQYLNFLPNPGLFSFYIALTSITTVDCPGIIKTFIQQPWYFFATHSRASSCALLASAEFILLLIFFRFAFARLTPCDAAMSNHR